MNDWFKRCEHGQLFHHTHFDDSVEGVLYHACSGISPVTIADLEALGEKVWWCEVHQRQATGTWCESYIKAFPCRVVERLLIPIPDEQP